MSLPERAGCHFKNSGREIPAVTFLDAGRLMNIVVLQVQNAAPNIVFLLVWFACVL